MVSRILNVNFSEFSNQSEKKITGNPIGKITKIGKNLNLGIREIMRLTAQY
jgi:hypothetical protein